ILAAHLRVTAEIEVAAVGDALELRPAEGELVLDVGAPLGVVRQLVGSVLAQTQAFGPNAVALVPREALLLPVLMPLRVLARLDEEFHLHLLELARAEEKIAGRDLVAERLADLADPERDLETRGVQHVLKIDEDALGRLGAQVHRARRIL